MTRPFRSTEAWRRREWLRTGGSGCRCEPEGSRPVPSGQGRATEAMGLGFAAGAFTLCPHSLAPKPAAEDDRCSAARAQQPAMPLIGLVNGGRDRMTSPHVHQREGKIPPAAALHRLVDPDHGERL